MRNLQLLECALATTVPPAVLASCLDELIGTAVDTLCQLQITQALADDAGSDGSADACLTLCLNTLNQLLKAGGADALLPHVRQIVPLLLEAARQSPPARNRALALMCLGGKYCTVWVSRITFSYSIFIFHIKCAASHTFIFYPCKSMVEGVSLSQ